MFAQNFTSSRRRVISVLILIILLAAIPLTIFLASQKQEIRQQASEPLSDSTVMLTINNQNFSLGDIKKVASEQYDPSSFNTQVLKIAQDNLIERKILDLKAKEAGLVPVEEEISALTGTTGLSREETRYDLIRQKLIRSEVRYIRIISIGYWVPPSDQREDYAQADIQKIENQIADGGAAISQAEQGLRAGEHPVRIIESILQKSAILSDALALNGYIFNTLKTDSDKQTASEPSLYEYADSNFDAATRDKLFSPDVSEGDIVRIGPTSDSGGESVFKIAEKKNESGTESYKTWLNRQKDLLVNIKTPL